jgi:hypothetical protein
MNRRFRGKYHFHFEGRKSAEQDPVDGGHTFLRNVGSLMDYTALYPSRWQHSFTFRNREVY